MQEFEALIAERPDDADLLAQRALVLCLLGRVDDAMASLEPLLKSSSPVPGGWPLACAVLLDLVDDRAGARECLAEAEARGGLNYVAAWRRTLGDTRAPRPVRVWPRPWPGQLVAWAWGELAPDQLLAAAEAIEGPRARMRALQEAHCLIGLGLAEEALAIPHFQAVVDLGDTLETDYVWAFARLARAGHAPKHGPPRIPPSDRSHPCP